MWGLVASAAVQAAGSYGAGRIAEYQYEVKSAEKELQAHQATAAANKVNLELTQNYNDIAAANAVMGAVSGRASNSAGVLNMTRADQERLNWDLDYSTMSGEMSAIGLKADAAGYKIAGEAAKSAALQQGLLSVAESYVSSKFGGSNAKYKQVG